MYISDLPNSTPGSGAEVPFDQSGATYKASLTDFYNGMTAANGSYKTYSSVTQLGLTSGSATIGGAWAALPTYSILIAAYGDFPAGQRPTTYGAIRITKLYNNNNGNIEWISGNNKWIMNISDGVPSGTWYREVTSNALVVDTKSNNITVNANAANTVNITVSKTGYTPIGVVGFNVSGTGSGDAVLSRNMYLINSSTVNVAIRNVSNTNHTWSCEIYVLYIAN